MTVTGAARGGFGRLVGMSRIRIRNFAIRAFGRDLAHVGEEFIKVVPKQWGRRRPIDSGSREGQ